MIKKKYSYYAVFNYDDDGITIEFPDLPGCISCGYSHDEALKMAKEALELYLDGMNEDEIPESSNLTQIKIVKPNQKIVLIEVVLIVENSHIWM